MPACLRPPSSRFRRLALASLLWGAWACQAGSGDGSGGAPDKSVALAATPGHALQKGELAPDVSGLSHIGYRIRLSSFTSQGPVAIYFCDVIENAHCSAVSDAIRDGWLGLQHRLSMVLIATPHASVANAAYASQHDLPFLLLSDAEGSLAREFGLAGQDGSAYGFVIDRERRIVEACSGAEPAAYLAVLERSLPPAAPRTP